MSEISGSIAATPVELVPENNGWIRAADYLPSIGARIYILSNHTMPNVVTGDYSPIRHGVVEKGPKADTVQAYDGGAGMVYRKFKWWRYENSLPMPDPFT